MATRARDLGCSILDRLARGAKRWATPLATLARDLAVEPDALDAAIAELQEEHLVELWPEAPGGPSALLSALARSTLGLAPPDDADQGLGFARKRDAALGVHPLGDVGPVADPRAIDPARAAEWAETEQRIFDRSLAEARARPTGRKGPRVNNAAVFRLPSVLPTPRRLLGSSGPWRGPVPAGAECYVCGGELPPGNCYCLLCERWTFDAAVPEHIRVEVQASWYRGRPGDDGRRLAGGLGRK